MDSNSTTIWVAVIFLGTAVFSFFVNVIRDRRNRVFDDVERKKQAATIKTEIEAAARIAKQDTADIALKVESALHLQQDETNIHLSEQAAMVEEAIKRQEVATRTDVKEVTAAVNKGAESAAAAYKEANTINQKLSAMSRSGLAEVSKDDFEDVERIENQQK